MAREFGWERAAVDGRGWRAGEDPMATAGLRRYCLRMKAIPLFTGILALLALMAGGCSQNSASANKADYIAQLTGDGQVPSVTTSATGTASFWINADGTEIRYQLTVANLQDVTMAHLHLGELGKNGPPIVWLYPSAPPAKEISGPSNGQLSDGTIKAENLVGPMAGKTIGDLVTAIKAHDVYVNVHTSKNPDGEIRAQVF